MQLSLCVLVLSKESALTSYKVLKPSSGSVCHGGTPCTVEWIEDGDQPLLNAIGTSTVGLFTGNQVGSLICQNILHSCSKLSKESNLLTLQTRYRSLLHLTHRLGLIRILSTRSCPHTLFSKLLSYIAFSSADLQVNGSRYTAFSPFFRFISL